MNTWNILKYKCSLVIFFINYNTFVVSIQSVTSSLIASDRREVVFSKCNSERTAECGKMPARQDDWFPSNQQPLKNVREQLSFLRLVTYVIAWMWNISTGSCIGMSSWQGGLRTANLHHQFELGNWSGASLGASAKAFSEDINWREKTHHEYGQYQPLGWGQRENVSQSTPFLSFLPHLCHVLLLPTLTLPKCMGASDHGPSPVIPWAMNWNKPFPPSTSLWYFVTETQAVSSIQGLSYNSTPVCSEAILAREVLGQVNHPTFHIWCHGFLCSGSYF